MRIKNGNYELLFLYGWIGNLSSPIILNSALPKHYMKCIKILFLRPL
jgi:hypothetical protein